MAPRHAIMKRAARIVGREPRAIELGRLVVPAGLVLTGWRRWRLWRRRASIAGLRAVYTLAIGAAINKTAGIVLGKPQAVVGVMAAAIPVGIVQVERGWRGWMRWRRAR